MVYLPQCAAGSEGPQLAMALRQLEPLTVDVNSWLNVHNYDLAAVFHRDGTTCWLHWDGHLEPNRPLIAEIAVPLTACTATVNATLKSNQINPQRWGIRQCSESLLSLPGAAHRQPQHLQA